MQSKQTHDNTKHTNIRLPANIYDEIEKLANDSQRTISGQIRFMLIEYIKIKNNMI